MFIAAQQWQRTLGSAESEWTPTILKSTFYIFWVHSPSCKWSSSCRNSCSLYVNSVLTSLYLRRFSCLTPAPLLLSVTVCSGCDRLKWTSNNITVDFLLYNNEAILGNEHDQGGIWVEADNRFLQTAYQSWLSQVDVHMAEMYGKINSDDRLVSALYPCTVYAKPVTLLFIRRISTIQFLLVTMFILDVRNFISTSKNHNSWYL